MGGAPIRLRDVGYAEDGMAEKRTFAYYKNKPAVILDVRRQTGTNTVKVVDAIQAKTRQLTGQLPPGVQIDVIKEQATYIKAPSQRSKSTWCSAACWPPSSSGCLSATGAWC